MPILLNLGPFFTYLAPVLQIRMQHSSGMTKKYLLWLICTFGDYRSFNSRFSEMFLKNMGRFYQFLANLHQLQPMNWNKTIGQTVNVYTICCINIRLYANSWHVINVIWILALCQWKVSQILWSFHFVPICQISDIRT